MSGNAISDYSPEIMSQWSANQTSTAGAGTNTNGFGNIMQYGDWLQGFGSILSGVAGYKQYQLGKDQLAFSKDAFNFNKNMQLATALAQAQGRLAEQQAYGGRQDLGYLQNLIQTLQGYGQSGQNTASSALQSPPTQQQPSGDWMGGQAIPSSEASTQPPVLGSGATPPPRVQSADDLRFARRGG